MAEMQNMEYNQSEIATQKPRYADSRLLTGETANVIKIPLLFWKFSVEGIFYKYTQHINKGQTNTMNI